jgi:hypothetical protein
MPSTTLTFTVAIETAQVNQFLNYVLKARGASYASVTSTDQIAVNSQVVAILAAHYQTYGTQLAIASAIAATASSFSSAISQL